MEHPENADKEKEEEEKLGTQSTVESAGPCKRRIKAEVPSQKVEEELDRNYRELLSSVQIPGFRRGHVPRRLIEKRYGEEIEGDVKEALLGLSFAEVVKEKDLKVLGKPRFDNIAFQKGEPLRYEVEVEVRPEFELGSYTGVEVEGEEPPPVKAEEIDLQLEGLRRKFADLAAVDPGQAGPEDLFLGHYTLRRDGIKVHFREEARFMPSSGNLDGFDIPDLAEKVASRGGSSTFSATVKVPANYSEEVLRGAQVDLEFTIEETRRVQLPPLDDELAKLFDAPTLADLRSRVEKQIEAQQRRLLEERLESRVLDRISEGVQFDLPESLLDEQQKRARLRLEFSLLNEGRSREEIDAELKKLDESGASEEIRREFKRFFILEKIAEVQKLYATEDEVEKRVALLAQAYRRSPQAIVEELEESDRMETLRTEIRHEKVRRFLREKAKVTRDGKSAAGTPPAEEGAPPSPAPPSPAVPSPAVPSPEERTAEARAAAAEAAGAAEVPAAAGGAPPETPPGAEGASGQ